VGVSGKKRGNNSRRLLGSADLSMDDFDRSGALQKKEEELKRGRDKFYIFRACVERRPARAGAKKGRKKAEKGEKKVKGKGSFLSVALNQPGEIFYPEERMEIQGLV